MKVVQIPMTKADLFLRIFEAYPAYPGTLKRFEALHASFSAKARVLVYVNHLIRMHEWPREQPNLHANKLLLHVFVLELPTEQDLNVLQPI